MIFTIKIPLSKEGRMLNLPKQNFGEKREEDILNELVFLVGALNSLADFCGTVLVGRCWRRLARRFLTAIYFPSFLYFTRGLHQSDKLLFWPRNLMHILDYFVLIGYFGVILRIGQLAMRRVKKQEDYFLGGRSFGRAVKPLRPLAPELVPLIRSTPPAPVLPVA